MASFQKFLVLIGIVFAACIAPVKESSGQSARAYRILYRARGLDGADVDRQGSWFLQKART
jgi:hypothetical protein